MNKVVVYVEGGVVVSVMANTPKETEVKVFDVDNMKEEGKSEEQICNAWKKITKGMEAVL